MIKGTDKMRNQIETIITGVFLGMVYGIIISLSLDRKITFLIGVIILGLWFLLDMWRKETIDKSKEVIEEVDSNTHKMKPIKTQIEEIKTNET